MATEGSVETGGTSETETQEESRRDAIEAAFDAAESTTETTAESTPPGTGTGTPGDKVSDPETKSEPGSVVPEGTTTVPAEKPEAKDLSAIAPASWKPAAKLKWGTMDVEARQEVLRREREIAQTLTSTESARKFATNIAQAIDPYKQRFAQLGVAPQVAIGNLLRADSILSTAAPAQRAMYMAKLIKDYGIDLNELDGALSGQAPAQNPILDQVAQMLDKRLTPVNQFLSEQQQRAAQSQAQEGQTMAAQVDAMEANAEKYPYFQAVREDMADIYELMSKKGVSLTIEEAYNRAVGLNPVVSEQARASREAEISRVAAAAATARAGKAKKASLSISGSSTGKPSGQLPQPGDRRGTIEAAFDSLNGR